ncbi:MAG: protein kinase [Sandaracinaceae bacterium]|nr:protein kinase [Sandaracinaceae bacterium]
MDDSHALAATLAAPSEPAVSTPPEAVESLTGKHLDHFDIEELLGRGGMGEVYAAVDTSLDRPVAIKVLRGDVTSHADMTDRFLREARAQARLNHPNIVHIYYIGRRPHDGGPDSLFFAMERVPGGDLEDVLKRGETMPPEEARQAMIQVAQGLRAAQKAGVIHRDIKPSNLMVSEHGVIKIADFGLAKPMDGDNQITQEGALVGSPYYIAPEQAIGDTIDFRADMYSMGAAFHHLLVGEPPFDGPRPMAVVAKHLSEDLEPLAKRAPHVPPPLAKVVERLLEKKPQDRYADYDALIADLEAAAPEARAYAPFTTRAFSVLGDFVLAGLLIGFLGWIGLIIYLSIVTIGHGWRGQSPVKFLLGIEVRRDNGEKLGWLRAAARTLVSLWMPMLAGATLALSSGIPELLETMEGLRAESLADLQNLLLAAALSHGFLSVVYVVGLGVALFHPQNKTVHDMVLGTVVVYRLDRRVAKARKVASSSGVGSTSTQLQELGKKLGSRPPGPNEP